MLTSNFEELFQTIFNHTPDMMFLMSVDEGPIFTYVLMNSAALSFTGMSTDCYHKSLQDVLSPEEASFIHQHYLKVVESGQPVHYELESILRDGRVIGDTILTPIFGQDGRCQYVLATVRDITEKKQAEEKMRQIAYQDPLTGLPNRRLFNDDLHHAIETVQDSENIGLLFIDMDRFKVINDSLGHAFGDLVIAEVAKRLKCLIDSRTRVYRMGGDEFTLVMRGMKSNEDIVRKATELMRMFDIPVNIGSHEFRVTVSSGIVVFPENGKDAESLLKNADAAMYRAKAEGKNQFVFYKTEMNEKMHERLILENDLLKAVKNREFFLQYQPRMDISTGRMIGAEALIRWNHPTLGIVPPVQFIPLAEETGLIIPIEEWVLRTACEQAKKWQEAGFPPIRVSVNISANHFFQKNLANMVKDTLSALSLNSDWLEIEITESTLMAFREVVTETLQNLTSLGVVVSIDDFGTGYSSLSYLKHFPVHSLKVDRSFIQGIGLDTGDSAIVKAIITLANSLELKVVAEGVETEDQTMFLSEQGCTEVQGFLYHRPLEVNDIENILKQHHHLSNA